MTYVFLCEKLLKERLTQAGLEFTKISLRLSNTSEEVDTSILGDNQKPNFPKFAPRMSIYIEANKKNGDKCPNH
jgi:hypothetical protein